MGNSILEKIGVPLTRFFGGEKAAEHAKAYYEDLGQHEFKAAASEAIEANAEIARHWAQGIKHAARAVADAIPSVAHHDKPLDTPPAPKALAGKDR